MTVHDMILHNQTEHADQLEAQNPNYSLECVTEHWIFHLRCRNQDHDVAVVKLRNIRCAKRCIEMLSCLPTVGWEMDH